MSDSICQVCHRPTFDDSLCPTCRVPQPSGPLTFPPSGEGCWSVYDMGENHCGTVAMHGKKAWYEPSKIQQPLCVHELKALLLWMEEQEARAK